MKKVDIKQTHYILTANDEQIAVINITNIDYTAAISEFMVMGLDKLAEQGPHDLKLYDKLGNWCNPPIDRG